MNHRANCAVRSLRPRRRERESTPRRPVALAIMLRRRSGRGGNFRKAAGRMSKSRFASAPSPLAGSTIQVQSGNCGAKRCTNSSSLSKSSDGASSTTSAAVALANNSSEGPPIKVLSPAAARRASAARCWAFRWTIHNVEEMLMPHCPLHCPHEARSMESKKRCRSQCAVRGLVWSSVWVDV